MSVVDVLFVVYVVSASAMMLSSGLPKTVKCERKHVRLHTAAKHRHTFMYEYLQI